MPADQELRQSNPDLWRQYDQFFPDSTHPVISRLCLALVRRLAYLHSPKYWSTKPRPAVLPRPSMQAELENREFHLMLQFPKVSRLQAEISQLLDHIIGPISPTQRADGIRPFVQGLIDADTPLGYIPAIVQTLRRPRTGRPPTKQLAAVKALEMKLLNSKLTWKQLYEEVYRSGEMRRISTGSGLIEAEVRHLKQLLAKYDVPLT